jgi:hypothetical protein
MSYVVKIDIKELSLKIPKSEFDTPLRSQSIFNPENPKIYLQDDECSFMKVDSTEKKGFYVWEKKSLYCLDGGWNTCFDELKALCIKYKGTLIADCSGEEAGDMEYIRIRDGVEKKVKIIEE